MEFDNKSEIERVFAQLSPRADELYRFVIQYDSYINEPRDYGTGLVISMVEVHTLTMIQDEPGITVSRLAEKWARTKGAVSQNIAKLEDKKLIYREKDQNDNKIVHLYVTPEGERLSIAHKLFDNMDIMETKRLLLQECTSEEIDTFYKVLHCYLKLL